MRLAIAFLVVFFYTTAVHADAFTLNDGMPVTPPSVGVFVLEDPTKEFSTQDILDGRLDERFNSQDPLRTSKGISHAQWWLKFDAYNPHHQDIEWVMNFPFAIMDHVDVYHRIEGVTVSSFALGDKEARDQRPLTGLGLAAPFLTPAGMTSTIYVRIANVYGDAIDTYFEVSSPRAFEANQNSLHMLFGVIFGGGLLLFLYNLIVFALVRDRVYFWYLCYFAGALLSFTVATGLIGQWYATHTSRLSEIMPPIATAATFALVIQFSRCFLETRTKARKLDIWLRVMIAYFLIPPIAILIGNGAFAAQTVMFGGLALVILPIYSARRWFMGDKAARTFTLAWGIWIVAISILIARFFGWVPTNDLTLHIAWIGILGEAVLFAVALAERFVLMQKEKEKAEQKIRLTLETAKIELENTVTERTQQLRERNLELSNTNKQKDKFFSIIAHDLMGPFSILIGMSDFLKLKSAELSREKISEYSNDLSTAASNVFKLLENLLSWARLQQNEFKFEPQSVDVIHTTNDVIDLFRPVASQKKIDVLLVAPPTCVGSFDPTIIETVLRNLINNAIKFSPNGSKIHVSISGDERGAQFSVQDEGVGMSSEVHQKVLDIGEKISTKGTSGETGTGLGLALCVELIKLHGGTLSIESEPDAGSTFAVFVPTAANSIN